MALRDIGRRALGAARLDPTVYDDVARDEHAGGQALAIVVLAALASAVGRGGLAARPLAATVAVALVGWAVWAGVCIVAGAALLRGPQANTDGRALLRVLGFAAAPGVVQALGVWAPLRPPVFALAHLWTVVTVTLALRRTFEATSTIRALAVAVAGWVVQLVLTIVLLAALRPLLAASHGAVRRPAAGPTAGYVGVVKPSGVAPPVE